MKLSRRNLIAQSAKGAAFAFAAPGLPVFAQTEPHEPHFFLNVVFPGGMDPVYSIDSRPQAMTAAGLLRNYMTSEPERYQGSNGNSALLTETTKPLRKHLDRFSLINGVIMVPSFDGHENNIGYFMTGNAFGGEAIEPYLNQASTSKTPIDYVQAGGGTLLTTITNNGNSVPLTPGSAKSFADRLKTMASVTEESPLHSFVKNRFGANAVGNGKFAKGSKAMEAGFTDMPILSETLRRLAIEDGVGDEMQQTIQMIGELFRGRVAKSAVIVFNTDLNPDQNLDTHDADSAKKLPVVMTKLMGELGAIISYLRDTAFDDQRSLLDVTTVLVGSEFGRTMRQPFAPFENSGTDHNPMTNSLFIGGKGIKGGLVAGGSDFQTAKEVLSGAHRELDRDGIKIMGRPLDFATLAPRGDAPAKYDAYEYLNFASVTNTLLKLFKADPALYRIIERNQPAAKPLDLLLS